MSNTSKIDIFKLGDKEFNSRLLLGTGKYPSTESLKEAIETSETEVVTVALRRVNLKKIGDSKSIISAIDRTKQVILSNTSGARDAKEAIRLAHLAREAGAGNWIKIEVTPEPRYLMPDPVETLKASEQLVKDGFIVLPYMHADPILAKKLEDVGVSAVMPLGSPIGTNKGIITLEFVKMIIEQSNIPVIVDAGLGAPSHVSYAMELGADAVLVNTAIAIAKDVPMMAKSFKLGVEAGRTAYLAGLAKANFIAEASSPRDFL